MKWLISATVLVGLMGCQQTETKTSTVEEKGLSVTGELFSLKSASISPPAVDYMWNYKIEYLAPENQAVKKGDLVLKFDAMELNNKLMEKQSELNAQTKQAERDALQREQEEQELSLKLAEAKMNFEKEQRKVEIIDVASTEVKKRKQQKAFEIAQLSLAQAQKKLQHFYVSEKASRSVSESKITRLQTQVEKIKKDISSLSVQSPKEGIVMYVANHNGEKPAVGETVWLGNSILTIPSLDAIAIKVYYDEPDTQKVALEQPVKIALEAYPEIPLQGKVSSIGQSYRKKSRNNPKIVFDAVIELDEINPSIMRPGMQAKVELVR